MKSCIIKITLFLCIATFIPAFASADTKIKFGVPPWPGVTVKTNVVVQLLSAMGYESEMLEVGPPIIYKSMSQNDMDVFLAGWTPQQNPMLDPLVEKGEAVKVRTNLSDALIGMCVSKQAWDGGVKSVGDLNKHAAKFDKTIYDIEPGSGMHTAMSKMIANNVGQLGEWEHVGTTTPVMLAEAGNRIKADKWVVFGCWKPHWMAVRMDIKFLNPIPGTEDLISASDVYTVTRAGFVKQYPQIQKLLENFVISSQTQSEWINEHGYKNKEAADVASEWIANNLDTVKTWLEGVKTADGKDAFKAVKAKYSK
ncbi:glycine betaine ABC transporter substrate-binding protein [Desulfovibrio sp. JC010]|uniref:glycine betaine ABC transporter substrate-binding protein n=1 Tax=Desulfovibrio sp. JC010 TaxID=2593641 RepID=UPI0013D16E22|nr:glycine betaine ABC transporter substrate-binding protein [Desulfovibrio sp. JC010]NDV28353.1 glycine/betaine ABC transporter substrate-binding protein [Desulfovibrio sp. JC010]